VCAATRQTTPNLASFDPTLLPLCKQLEAQAFAPFGFGFTARKSCESQRQGFRVGGRSRGRFVAPADFPLHDGTSYSHVRVRRESLGFVHRSRAIFCRPVPSPTSPIRNFGVAVRQLALTV
jgi:hypothetical protein